MSDFISVNFGIHGQRLNLEEATITGDEVTSFLADAVLKRVVDKNNEPKLVVGNFVCTPMDGSCHGYTHALFQSPVFSEKIKKVIETITENNLENRAFAAYIVGSPIGSEEVIKNTVYINLNDVKPSELGAKVMFMDSSNDVSFGDIPVSDNALVTAISIVDSVMQSRVLNHINCVTFTGDELNTWSVEITKSSNPNKACLEMLIMHDDLDAMVATVEIERTTLYNSLMVMLSVLDHYKNLTAEEQDSLNENIGLARDGLRKLVKVTNGCVTTRLNLRNDGKNKWVF